MNLDEFKEIYSGLQKKHKLPDFDELNLNFDIGKIKRDSGNFLRDIRRIMVEKLVYYNKLVELMINPSGATPILLMLLKEITNEDKKIIDSVLNSFVELEIESHKLDVFSTETGEAKLINQINNVWKNKKDEVMSLIRILERNLKKVPVPQSNKKNRDYFN